MSKWLSASALALLLALPAFAQSADPRQPQGSEAKASGDATPSAAAESKSSGQPVGTAKSPGSGASGMSRPADGATGAAKPPDDSSSADAYKKDFEKK